MKVVRDGFATKGVRKVAFLAFVLICLFMTPYQVVAQDNHKTPLLTQKDYGTINGVDSLPGIDPSSAYAVSAAVDTVPGDSSKVLYFYNIGTKKFLSVGGYWGTHASLNSTPHALWMEPIAGNNTAWYVNNRVLGSGTGHHMGMQNGNLFMDKGQGGTSKSPVSFVKAKDYTDKCKLYLIKVGDNYITTYPNNEQRYCNYEAKPYDDADTLYKNQEWKIITLKDYYSLAFADPANMEAVLDFSFIMHDPNFRVNNTDAKYWQVAVPKGDNAADPQSKIFFGDDKQYCTYANRDKSGPSHFAQGTYGDGQHQRFYGKYFYCYTKGADGYWLYEKVKVHKPGWYLIRCNGFTTQTMASSNSAQATPAAFLFMSVVQDDGSITKGKGSAATLNLLGKDEARTLIASDEGAGAGKAFFDGKYENQVQLCFSTTPDGEVISPSHPLTIGVGIYVEKTGGTPTDDDMTCVDNFKLLYAGAQRNTELILDEDNDNLLYLTRAKDVYKNTVLHLRRTLNAKRWNSLILPVDLNWGQMKRTFGDDVKVAKLANLEGSTIQFVTVSCKNDSDLMVKAFEPYIIYPPVAETESPAYTVEKFYTKEGDNNANWLNAACTGSSTNENDRFSLTIPKNHFDITRVSFDREAFRQHVDSTNWVSKTRFAADGVPGHMECLGTVAKTFGADGVLPGRDMLSGDYIFYKGDIVQVPHDKQYGLKGFRCWFELNGTHDIYHPKAAEFYLDGVKQTGVTGIDQIHGHEVFSARQHRLSGVYNLEGQRVSASSSTAGLPKGIYIIDGKKIILK